MPWNECKPMQASASKQSESSVHGNRKALDPVSLFLLRPVWYCLSAGSAYRKTRIATHGMNWLRGFDRGSGKTVLKHP